MKIAIFGGTGQLGADLVDYFRKSHEVFAPTHEQLDIANIEQIAEFLLKERPQLILNAAAYHHVEKCEEFQETAYQLNVLAPERMALMAKELRAKFIHFSTDYVFDGSQHQPYTESDLPNPLNVYGKTKWEGEQRILSQNRDAIIMRVSGLYGMHPCRAKNGLNFVQLMLKLAKEKGEVTVVDDEFVSPTYTENIAMQVAKLIDSDLSGIVHATSEGQCSWYDFAQEIFAYTHTNVLLKRASGNAFPAKVPRPKYSVLENEQLKQKQLNVMLPWQTALHAYLDATQERLNTTT